MSTAPPTHSRPQRGDELELTIDTLAFGVMALIVKLTRAAMVTVLEQDYIAFAQARAIGRPAGVDAAKRQVKRLGRTTEVATPDSIPRR